MNRIAMCFAIEELEDQIDPRIQRYLDDIARYTPKVATADTAQWRMWYEQRIRISHEMIGRLEAIA